MQIDVPGNSTLAAPELHTDGSTSSSEQAFLVAPSPSKARRPESSSALRQTEKATSGAPPSTSHLPIDGLTADSGVDQNYRTPFGAEDEGSEDSESEFSDTEEGPVHTSSSTRANVEPTGDTADAIESEHSVSKPKSSGTPRASNVTVEIEKTPRVSSHTRFASTPAHQHRTQPADESGDGFSFAILGPADPYPTEERWEDNVHNGNGPAPKSAGTGLSQSSVEDVNDESQPVPFSKLYGLLADVQSKSPVTATAAPPSAQQRHRAPSPPKAGPAVQSSAASHPEVISDSETDASGATSDTEPAHRVTSHQTRNSQSPAKQQRRGKRHKRKISETLGSQSPGSSQGLDPARQGKKAKIQDHFTPRPVSSGQAKASQTSTSSAAWAANSPKQEPMTILDDDKSDETATSYSSRQQKQAFFDPPAARTRSAPSSLNLRDAFTASSSSLPSTSQPTSRTYPDQHPGSPQRAFNGFVAVNHRERGSQGRRTPSTSNTHIYFDQKTSEPITKKSEPITIDD